MTTQHIYAAARSLTDAMENIISLAGSQYDPEVVAALQSIWQDGRLGLIHSNQE
jgi:HD-GYP domain-containing protein (c-di-GMP phosphodiesterase class II)